MIFNPILYDNSGWYKLACVLSALRILKLVETSEKFRRPFQVPNYFIIGFSQNYSSSWANLISFGNVHASLCTYWSTFSTGL